MIPDGSIEAALAAADAARATIRRYFRAGLGADDKADASPVTAADRAVETAMRVALELHTPGFGVIGEEFGDDRRGRFNWVIDPIDGTREFITGRTSFVTLIGLVEDGVPVLGLIDQPVTGERWLASGGRIEFSGPFGGVPGCRRRAALGEAELSCTGPEWFAPDERAAFERLSCACKRVSWGDNAYAAGLLALGAIDIIAEAGHKPWDWAASVPIVEAAGGAICDWDGRPLRLDAQTDGTVLILGDPSLRAVALSILRSDC